MMSNSKRVKFRIEFGRVENLQNGAEVFIKWGKTLGERTRIVYVQNNAADFSGESFQHELVLHRNKKMTSSWNRQLLTFRLCTNLGGKKDGVIGLIHLDLSRFTNNYQTEVVRPLELHHSGILPKFMTNHQYLKTGLLMPVLHYKVTCLWNDLESGGLRYPQGEQRERVRIVDDRQPKSMAVNSQMAVET